MTGFQAGTEARLLVEPRDTLGAAVAATTAAFVSVDIAPSAGAYTPPLLSST
jgi:hypothetical protein